MLGTVLIVCILLFLPLWSEKIAPNRFYGYRTKFSLANSKNWYRMNKFAARLFVVFFGGIALAELFVADRHLIWILLFGTVFLVMVCLLEEKRLKFFKK